MDRLLFFFNFTTQIYSYICETQSVDKPELISDNGQFKIGYAVEDGDLTNIVIFIPEDKVHLKATSSDKFEIIPLSFSTRYKDLFQGESDYITKAIRGYPGKLASVKFVKTLTGLNLKQSKWIVDDVLENPAIGFWDSYLANSHQ